MSKKNNGKENDEISSLENPLEDENLTEPEIPEKVTSELENELQKELESQKDKYIRLFAEFDNYKKRTAREIYEIRQTGAVSTITTLLEVLDDMDRAEVQFKEGSETKEQVLEGTQLIFNKFRKKLEQQGLKPIETLHTEFDVEKDEAISEMPVDDENMKGKVVAEVQKGYFLNDKLIRFAKVVVGK